MKRNRGVEDIDMTVRNREIMSVLNQAWELPASDRRLLLKMIEHTLGAPAARPREANSMTSNIIQFPCSVDRDPRT